MIVMIVVVKIDQSQSIILFTTTIDYTYGYDLYYYRTAVRHQDPL